MMVVETHFDDHVLIELLPNRSASWQQTKWVIAVMVAFVLIIALAWTFVGAWFVLPFAGIEVGLFAFLMYKVSKLTYRKQCIHIYRDTVLFEQGRRRASKKVKIPREYLDFYFIESDLDWELPKLELSWPGGKLSIGEFLNLDDRKEACLKLNAAGLIALRNRWWQS